MLGIDARAARYAWTVAFVTLLLVLVYLIRATVFVFILALLFAYLLSPLVNLLDRVLPGSRTRTPALALAYILFVGLLVLFGVQIGSRAVQQAKELTVKFPAMIQSWSAPPNSPEAVNNLKSQIAEKLRVEIAKRSGDLISLLPEAGIKFVTVAGDLLYVIIIPILAFFFLKDGHEIRRHLLDLAPDRARRVLADDLMADIHLLLAHYMRALFALAVAAFTAFTIFFLIMGVHYGLLLAALAGMLEFIPMVGPLSAAVIILIVAAVAKANLLAILIFIAIYRLFQDYVLSPHLMGQGVELHPLLVLFGVFAGAEIAGVAGTFLSVPVLALARIIYRRIRKSRLNPQLEPAKL
jgi:predicted PurR-regulated permease PerM